MEKPILETELNVMRLLWEQGDLTAKEISIQLGESVGWNKATSYTIIKRLLDKGLVQRLGFNFTCHVTMTKEEAQQIELNILKEKLFSGSTQELLAALLRLEEMDHAEMAPLMEVLDTKSAGLSA